MNILILQTSSYYSNDHQNFYIRNESEYIQALTKYFPDIIIADLETSCVNWKTALDLKFKKSPLASFILTGIKRNEDLLMYLKSGVDECVYEDENSNLNAAVYSACEKKTMRSEKKVIEQNLKGLFDNNPATKFIVDPDTQKFLALNKAGEKFYGYTQKEFLNLKTSDINVLPDKRINNAKERAADEISNFTIPQRLKNGEIRYVELYVSNLFYQGRNCYQCIVIDITEKLADQKKLIEEKKKAEELNQLKNDFMASMSHELRNPLFGILSNAEFLNNTLEGEHKEEALHLYESAIRLFKTVEEMLKFSDLKINSEKSGSETITERKAMQEQYTPKVLIVEDELINMLSLKKMLFREHNIFTAKDAETALSIVHEEKMDAILMDINLKADIDGVQLTKIIRRIKGYESIPIIAMTAYAFPGEKERFLSNGFTHYISKPFSTEQLLQLMAKIFTSDNSAVAEVNS